jgi:hypothetical protein
LKLKLAIIQVMLGEAFGKQDKFSCMVVGGGLGMVLALVL